MFVLNFLCVHLIQINHINYLQAFPLFQSSSSQLKMGNHYEVHIIFKDFEHQLQGNILHNFLQYSFYKIFIKFRSIFDPLKIIFLKLMQHCPTI